MGFSADLSTLAGLPALLERRGHELDYCRGYLLEHAGMVDAGPAAAVEELRIEHTRLVPVLAGALAGYAAGVRGRAAAVRAALARYATTDLNSAAALDAAVPLPAHHGRLAGTAVGGTGAAVESGHGGVLFADGWVAAGYLRFPPEFRISEVPAPTWTQPVTALGVEQRILSWFAERNEMFAESAARLDQGVDRATIAISGDWAAVLTHAYAFDSMANAVAAIQQSITNAGVTLGQAWTGHAAAGCTIALNSDASRLGRLGWTLHALAQAYRPAGEAARAVAVTAESLLTILANSTVEAVVGVGVAGSEIPGAEFAATQTATRLIRARQAAAQAASRAITLVTALI